LAIGCLVSLILLSATLRAQDEGVQYFEKHVRPVLRRECLTCHHVGKASGSLALDSRDGWKNGGDSGPAIVPGEPAKSLLIRAIRHEADVVAMPAKAPKLADDAIAVLEKWIRMGAPDPRDQPEKLANAAGGNWDEIARERTTWWCWQPLKKADPGAAVAPTIDDWIDRQIAAEAVVAAERADRRTLIRRLSYQLCGLPPTPEEVEALDADQSPDAWEKCVDRFLAKPDFGIHWARHWLDVVRYAETHGSEDDAVLPFSYRYRDYIIRALQNDLPYNQLIREHLAGDLVPPRWNRELGINEALIGTAFLRFVEFNQTPVDVKREEIVVIDNQIDAIGKAFQGLTISCARCHDHKFDPISDEDYYALYGILRSTRSGLRVIDDPAVFDRDRGALTDGQTQIRERIAPAWIVQTAAWPAELEQARLWCQEHVKPETQWKDIRDKSPDSRWTRALAGALCKPDPKEPGSGSRMALAPLARILTGADEQLSEKGESLRRELAEQVRRSAALPQGAQVLFDLTRGDLPGWQIVGAGLAVDGLSQPGAWSIQGGRDPQFVGVLERGYHSNRVSDRHGGSLRSPDFILDMDEISVLARGSGGARARLVIENFQGDSLLFEGVNPTLQSPVLRWYTMPIRPQWRGLRAHLELLTRDDKPYIGVTKDPNVLERSDGRSSFGLALVVKHPRGARPADPPAVALEILIDDASGEGGAKPSRNRAQWIDAICAATKHALERWQKGTATDNDARWITMLLEAEVLQCRLPTDAMFTQLIQKYRQREQAIPTARRVPGVLEDHCAVNQPWLPRGDHRQGGEAIPRRYLEVLGSSASSYAGTASGRLRLADEIAGPGNPLTARVYVNRVWHWLFGRGIVATVDNFGRMGEAPTHPELLDQLALEFMQDGWSTKRLIRRLVLTRTWQRASMPSESAVERDPGNRCWSHASVRRLEAESIRDTMLFVSGKLRLADSGPGTLGFYRVVQEPNKQSPPGPLDGDNRRSIFLEVRRNFPNELLLAFDFPRPAAPVGRRPTAIVPSQSLTLMNHPFVLLQGRLWAERVRNAEPTREGRVRRFYRELLNREPTDDERQQAESMVETMTARADEARAWQLLAHAMFNLKEAIYLP
jgi:hypothetical protein